MHLPPYSPGMHSVIEHCHAVVCGRLRAKDIVHSPPPASVTLDWYIRRLTTRFFEHTPAVCEADVRWLLSKTLPAIVQRQGYWPPKPYR